MILETLLTLFTRDLNRLKSEIASYKSEEAIWLVEKSITNSAGNLCLHLVGNIKTYIGANLGDNDYVRNREFEFAGKDVPRAELIQQIEETLVDVKKALHALAAEDLAKEYPYIVFDKKTTTGYLLVHLTTHLTYHLGQINYHRRLLDR